MESKLNKEIREVLELFDIEIGEVKGDFNIVGHLVNAARKNGAE